MTHGTKTLPELEKELAEIKSRRVAVQDLEGLKREYRNKCSEIDKLKEAEAKTTLDTSMKSRNQNQLEKWL